MQDETVEVPMIHTDLPTGRTKIRLWKIRRRQTGGRCQECDGMVVASSSPRHLFLAVTVNRLGGGGVLLLPRHLLPEETGYLVEDTKG